MKNMRRVIAAFTAAAFMASTLAVSVHAESVMLGDANGDGYVDAFDMMTVLTAITALGVGNEVDAGFNEEDGDVNQNGTLDMNDVYQLYYYGAFGGFSDFSAKESTESKSVSLTDTTVSISDLESNDYQVSVSIELEDEVAMEFGVEVEDGCTISQAPNVETMSAYSYAITESENMMWYAQSASEYSSLIELTITLPETAAAGDTFTVSFIDQAIRTAQAVGASYVYPVVGNTATITVEASDEVIEPTEEPTETTTEETTTTEATTTTEETTDAADRYDIAVTPISVTDENEYFECVDDYIVTKKSGYYLMIEDNGDSFTSWAQRSDLLAEVGYGETLSEAVLSTLDYSRSSVRFTTGEIYGFSVGEKPIIMVYSQNGSRINACYQITLNTEGKYTIHMRYWRDDEANAAGGNVEAKYDVQLKIDTEAYTVGPEYEENFQVAPPEKAIIGEVYISGDSSNYKIEGLDEGVSMDDITITFYKNGTYTFRAATTYYQSLSYTFEVDTIVEETTTTETTTTETTTTTESTTTETTTTETTTTTESTTTETTSTETTTTTESTTTETTTTETTTTTESTTTETTTTETTTTTESTTTETTTTETTTTDTSTTETIPSETTKVSLGDLNNDTEVDASDAAMILVAAAAVGAGDDSGLTEEQEKAADVNNDGAFDAVDAALVLQYAAAAGAGYTGSIGDFLAEIKEENSEEDQTITPDS